MDRMLTASAVSAFRDFLISDEKSHATVGKYIRDILSFAAFSDGEITRETVLDYKNFLVGKYSASSVNSMLVALNRFFDFSGRHDLKVKTLKLQKKVFCPEEKELSKAEYKSLCRAAEQNGNRRISLIIQTICGTGIRVGELRYITVEAAKKGNATVTCKAKTRTVFIVRELQKKLLRYAAEQGIKSGMIFVTRNGNPINRITVWREMKNLCAAAGVDSRKVFPHNLRHLFARVFWSVEKDIAKLADILGHSSIDTMRIYIISTGEEHRRRMENMHLIL